MRHANRKPEKAAKADHPTVCALQRNTFFDPAGAGRRSNSFAFNFPLRGAARRSCYHS
jgi:hypothetical protein